MKYVLDVLIIIFLFGLFGFSHSLLASVSFKEKLKERIGTKIAFYRLFYNITSAMIFIVAYDISPKPDLVIYELDYPYDIFVFALQILPFIGLIWASKNIDLKEFIGINQVLRFINNNYKEDDLDEISVFRNEGAYKISRHPIYLFSIIYLFLRPSMDLFFLVFASCLTIYFYIGSVYEEKKLAAVFGEDYCKYREQVGRIFPKMF